MSEVTAVLPSKDGFEPSGRQWPTPERTPFVGRQAELETLSRSVEHSRLVTILGCGGMGKTRLVREFCRQNAEPFSSCRFLNLGEVLNEDQLAEFLAREVGTTQTSSSLGDVVNSFGRALARSGPSVVVLDGFEQLVELAHATIGRWLDAAPACRFIVTSRRRLDLAGEVALSLPPLATEVAVELFRQRVRLWRPEFVESHKTQIAIGAIVGKLDCIPLALELAASRTRLLSCEELVQELRQSLGVLGAGPVDAANRQRTVDATVKWSLKVLPKSLETTLCQLAVFRNGFTIEAARNVVETPRSTDLLEALDLLLDHSLVFYREGVGRRRFFVFEIVRANLLATLEQGEFDDLSRRHAEYFGSFGASEEESALPGEDIDNAVAAHEWAAGVVPITPETAELAIRTAVALESVLAVRGPFGLGECCFDRCVSLLSHVALPTRLQSRVFEGRGRMRTRLGKLAGAVSDCERAVALAQASGDEGRVARSLLMLAVSEIHLSERDLAVQHLQDALPHAIEAADRHSEGRILANLGVVAAWKGEVTQARLFLENALVIHREVGDREGAANTLGVLGALYRPPHSDLARGYYGESKALHRQSGNRLREAAMDANLGMVEQEAGRFAVAARYYSDALCVLNELGCRGLVAMFQTYRGALDHERARYGEAREGYRQALVAAREVGDQRYSALALAWLAQLERTQGRPQESEALFAEADAMVLEDSEVKAAIALLQGRLAVEDLDDNLLNNGDVRTTLRLLKQVKHSSDSMSPYTTKEALLLSCDGARVRTPDGGIVDLSRRVSARRVLQRLAAERMTEPGSMLSAQRLFEAGWPDQRIAGASADNRVRVTVAKLRELGLRRVLLTGPDGYYLDPQTPIVMRQGEEAMN